MEAYNVFKNAECDGVVSVGGGSSHDCGKGDRAVAANDGKYIYDMAVFVDPPYLEQIKKSKLVIISQISVNTTADTGAESTNGGMGIVHGLGHGLSVLCGCHHGRANAVMALPLERYNEPSGPDKFAELAGAMGLDMRGMTKMQAADKWFDEIERLLADLNIKTGHLNEQFGLQHEDLEHIMRRQYENDFAMERNRIDFVFEDCIKLLEDLL